ncbi:hypothetical protein [Shimia marina]|uniref:Uncharacterized protein n=1 Tax=Shimia marina TaxID=321267 RepID=A0A0P1EKV5_9RHOB|nr:hypothetical protein [Shimia marina]CUH50977.1 hypothetical protein SHM7688_00409 [Shimia marina]SFD61191.1 hypothetical protein SAMN04488037_101693 [Shimia marina]
MSALALAVREVLLRSFPGDQWFELNDPAHGERAKFLKEPIVHHKHMSAAEGALNALAQFELCEPLSGLSPLWILAPEATFSASKITPAGNAILAGALMGFNDVLGLSDQLWEPMRIPSELTLAFEEIWALGVLDKTDGGLMWNDEAAAILYAREGIS